MFDSRWKASEAFELDQNPNVRAWAKNDRLGFGIVYSFRGSCASSDRIIWLVLTSRTLILEVKGEDDQQQETKRVLLIE